MRMRPIIRISQYLDWLISGNGSVETTAEHSLNALLFCRKTQVHKHCFRRIAVKPGGIRRKPISLHLPKNTSPFSDHTLPLPPCYCALFPSIQRTKLVRLRLTSPANVSNLVTFSRGKLQAHSFNTISTATLITTCRYFTAQTT